MSSRKRERMEQTSHKVIEKRRRDRINSCLTELSQAVPAIFSKQTSGKLEKAEILEMTVEYLRAVHVTDIGIRFDNGEWYSTDIWADFAHHYQSGYSECVREVIRYMTDVEGLSVSDTRCMRLVSFLHNRLRHESSPCGAAGSVAGGESSGCGTYSGNGTQSAHFSTGNGSSMTATTSSRDFSPVSTFKNVSPKFGSSASVENGILACCPSYLSAAASMTFGAGENRCPPRQHFYSAAAIGMGTSSCHPLQAALPFSGDLPRFQHSSKDMAAMFARTGASVTSPNFAKDLFPHRGLGFSHVVTRKDCPSSRPI